MTISATTQGLRMGVATSSSRPTVPFDGQVISETDTDSLQVYKGSAWAPVSGLTLITAQTIGTAVSSVAVTGVFSSTYDNYKVVLSGGTSSTDDIHLTLILGATTTGYYMAYTGANYSGASSSIVSNNNAASWTRACTGVTDGLQGNFELLGPNLAKRTMIIGAHISDTAARNYAGYLDNTTQYTAFTLTPDAGTITGGTIYVYGIAKA
jgi:hypothetical protein